MIGIPTAAIAGPIYARWIAPRIVLSGTIPWRKNFSSTRPIAVCRLWRGRDHHSAAGGADVNRKLVRLCDGAGSVANRALHLLGSADIALLVAVLISFVTLGKMRGFQPGDDFEIHQ